jgi:hypothetical protein
MLVQNPLNEYSLAFPVLECIHIAGFVCGVGAASLVNLRLLEVGLTQKSSAQLWRDAMPWTLLGLTAAIFSGLLLFSIDPEPYYENNAFRFKMLSLALALGFYVTAVPKAAAPAARGGMGRSMIACISLVLWFLVPFGGVFIGFVDSMRE